MKVNRNFVFLIICIFILLLGLFSLVRTPNFTSLSENRNLNLFPNFTLKTFLNSEYQTNFDNALSDQFVFGQTIKNKMNQITMFTDYTKLNKNICRGNYVNVKDDVYIYNCDSRLFRFEGVSDEDIDKIKNNIKKLKEKLDGKAELYFYFIDSSYSFDFRTNKSYYDFDGMFNGTNYDSFKFKDYEEFSKYFYKTDHHWNYKGSYIGYKDIIKLLLGDEEEVMVPEKLVDFKIPFNGSSARIAKISDFSDDFKAYKFNFKDHEEFLDRKIGTYGSYENYFNGNISNVPFETHYSKFYGDDNAEVIYDYNNDEKENILIIGNSFSNSVNSLIASHFNKTYVVDLRHYYDVFGEKFDYDNYIEKNNIDKVLILGHHTLYNSDYLEV